MKTAYSNNPDARRMTLELLHEDGEGLIDWVARLRDQRMMDEEILAFTVQRGFIDEEVQGCLIDLDFQFDAWEPSDFHLDMMLEISRLPVVHGGLP